MQFLICNIHMFISYKIPVTCMHRHIWNSLMEVNSFPGGSLVNNPRAMQETQEPWVRSLGWEDPLEEKMAPHSSMLAWRIPWTEEPGGQQSTGSQRVGHHWKIECAHPYRIKVGTVPDQEIQQEVNSVGQPLEGKWASRALPGICIFGAAGGISQWTCRVCEGCIDIPLE